MNSASYIGRHSRNSDFLSSSSLRTYQLTLYYKEDFSRLSFIDHLSVRIDSNTPMSISPFSLLTLYTITRAAFEQDSFCSLSSKHIKVNIIMKGFEDAFKPH